MKTENQKLFIYKIYYEYGIEESLEILKKHFNKISKTTIRRIVKELIDKKGLPRRDNSDSYRKYTLNKWFFSEIDSAEKAYWLGFLGADGNVYEEERRIEIELVRSDRLHLEKFAGDIGSNRPLESTSKDGNDYAKIALNSQQLLVDLKKYNITARKSKTFNPNLLLINSAFHRDFWRGMIDGDGSLKLNRYKKYEPTKVIELYGSRMACEKFSLFLKNELNITQNYRPHRSIFICSVQRTSLTIEICSHLYENSVVYLDRKKAIYDSWK